MKYDLSNPLHREQFHAKAEAVYKEGKAIVDFSVKKPVRTIQQNRYLHVILAYVALEFGVSLESVKQGLFKVQVNRDIFVREAEIGQTKTRYLRSTASLTTDEMTEAIERFRSYMAANFDGFYIPTADEHRMLQAMEVEVSRVSQWLS